MYIQQPFIAGGTGANTLMFSTDGLNWKGYGNSVFLNSCNGIGWNGNMWVAVGAQSTNLGTIAYSYDGINWSLANTPTIGTLNDVKWNGTMWASCGYPTVETNEIIYSYDGINWLSSGSPPFSSYAKSILWTGSLWYVVGSDGSNTICYTNLISANTQWTTVNKLLTIANSIASGNNILVAVGASGSSATSIIYSIGGVTWSSIGTTGGFSDPFSGGTANDIACNGRMFVSVGGGGTSTNSIAYSPDGINWLGVTGSITVLTIGNKVCWTGKKWLVSGTNSTPAPTQYSMAYSYDGIVWYGVPIFEGSSTISTNVIGISSNSRIGAIVVDSKLTLNNKNIPNTQTLDLSSGSYYDFNYTNFTSTITNYNI